MVINWGLIQDEGSGITLYVTYNYGSRFTVSIDGSLPNQVFFPGITSVMVKFVFYDQQSLQYGPHILHVAMLDENETPGSNSNFLFDFADINEANPNGTTSAANQSVSSGSFTGPTSTTTPHPTAVYVLAVYLSMPSCLTVRLIAVQVAKSTFSMD